MGNMDNYILICLLLIVSVLAVLLYKSKRQSAAENLKANEQVKKYQKIAEDAVQEKIVVEEDLKSKTALLADVSHEIRSRLHGIVSLSEFLSSNWDIIKGNDSKQYAATIFEASCGLINFTNDLLDYSKFNAGKMVFQFNEFDLTNSINEVVKYCKKMYLLESNVLFKLKNEITGEALIKGDKARINQLFMNLFINAIKYSEKGEIVAELKLINYNGKVYWEFILTDQGVGIPEDELENIFEPFIQGTRNRTGKKLGSGLGLAMCKQIVEAHSGNIWAENNSDGVGARFSFIIPALNTEN